MTTQALRQTGKDRNSHPPLLCDVLLQAAHNNPAADALIFPDQRQTFGELYEAALAHARSLIALGVKKGDHVGLLMPTCHDFVSLMFGISLAGAVVVPINARFRASELGYVINNGDLVAVITTDIIQDHVNFVERLGEAFPDLGKSSDALNLELPQAPKLKSIVVMGADHYNSLLNRTEFAALADIADPAEIERRHQEISPSDNAIMLFTSGTTANPKGCPITNEALVGNCIALAERYELDREDSFWAPLPMFHIAAILPMISIFTVGGRYTTMVHFEAGLALRMLEEEKVTAAYPCFATIMLDLVNHPDFSKTDLSRVRIMNSNLAMSPKEVTDIILRAMPQTIQVGTYGMTESAGTATTSLLTDPEDTRTSLCGVPLPGVEIMIADPASGKEVPTGERGEILLRGYSIVREYYKDEEKTTESISPDGWFHTGDIGSVNADGQLMFHGRLKDMLKVGGENVAAAEIESLLQKHPAVKLAQVVGIPDPRLVEVPAAFIELKPGSELDEEGLLSFCKGEISSFKIPRHIRFLKEWPMSTSKIQKFKLRENLTKELGL
ncbi:AMP-binding protein [Emcibacter sp.]|uniref:AMP-binding protein n=1 Tax=Emcibacter sp. TaxID=1979954 RepID=UPI002AA80D58|nr:AMP-binding protein [Emcibacter sp.]